jgi:hypothetical protein
MKYIYSLLIFIGLSGSAFGTDTKMQCEWYQDKMKTYYFKYSDNFFIDKAYMRIDGRWIDYCDGMVSTQKTPTSLLERKINNYTVKDKGASCTVYKKYRFTNGTIREYKQTWVLDFAIMKAKKGSEHKDFETGEFVWSGWFDEVQCKTF